jgi:hypothetical protein
MITNEVHYLTPVVITPYLHTYVQQGQSSEQSAVSSHSSMQLASKGTVWLVMLVIKRTVAMYS